MTMTIKNKVLKNLKKNFEKNFEKILKNVFFKDRRLTTKKIMNEKFQVRH